jgi:hypothetical protein
MKVYVRTVTIFTPADTLYESVKNVTIVILVDSLYENVCNDRNNV